MKYRIKILNLVIVAAALLIGGCGAGLKPAASETSFAGFRAQGEIVAPINDRADDLWERAVWAENYQSADQFDPDDMQPAAASQYNLIYHLYGPDYRYPYGSRIWASHRRRHNDILWGYGYGYDPYFDPYYQDPFWGMSYRQSWAYNSWTDPYFDFRFHDPFSYSHYYGYGYDPIYWGQGRHNRTRYGYTYASSTNKNT